VDVKESNANMEEMVKVANGRRDVPVIVQEGKVTIGYGGT